MTGEPRPDPTSSSPQAPAPPQQGHDVTPKLGREQPGRGLDTGVEDGARQPGDGNGRPPLD